jgi:hypothetical protein
MRDISKIALQACIMNSPLNVHAVESRIAEIQKIRDNVSSKHRLCIFVLYSTAKKCHSGILNETSASVEKRNAEACRQVE